MREVGVRFLPEELCFGEGEKTGEDEGVKCFEKEQLNITDKYPKINSTDITRGHEVKEGAPTN